MGTCCINLFPAGLSANANAKPLQVTRYTISLGEPRKESSTPEFARMAVTPIHAQRASTASTARDRCKGYARKKKVE